MRTTIALLLLCVTLRAVSLVRSAALSDDEAIYAVVGREMNAGHVLYRDVVDHKPPAIYVIYAVTQAIGGPRGGMLLVHLLVTLAVFATGLSLRRLVTAHTRDRELATIAAGLWLVFSTTMIDFDSLAANCELFMVLPLALSVECHLRGRALAAGALVGVAMLFKYQAGIHLPLYALHIAVTRRDLRAWLSLAVGSLGVLALACVALWWAGAWSAARFWFAFNFAYIQSGMSPLEVLTRAAGRCSIVIGGSAFIYCVGLRGAVRALRKQDEPPSFYRFVAGWLAVSAVAVCVGGRFYGHYFHQLTPALSVLGAPGALALWRSRKRLAMVAVAAPAIGFWIAGIAHAAVMRAIDQPDPDYPHMAKEVRRLAGPGGSLCIWGNLPVLYFEADLPLGCRFPFANYLSGMSPATNTQYDPAADASMNVVPEAWTMLEDDFRDRRPMIVADASFGDVANYGKFPVAKYPRLQALLADYRVVAVVDGVRIFRRVSASNAGANSSAAPRQVASPRIDAVPNERIP